MTTPPLKPPSSTCPVYNELPGMASAPGAARDGTIPDTQSGTSDVDEFPLTQQPDAAADPTPPNLTAELRRRRTGPGLAYAAMRLPIFFPTKTLQDGSPRDAYHTYGRHPTADVPIADDEHRAADGQLISAYHFLLYSRASGVYIVDTSRTGTLVNGKLLGDAHRSRVEAGVLPRYDDVKNIGYGPLKNGWQISLGRDNTSPGPMLPYDGMTFTVHALGGAAFLGGTGTRTSRKKSAPTGKFRAAERAATEAQRREARCQRFGTPHKAAAGDTKGYRKRRPGTQSKATAEKRKGKFVKKHKPKWRGRQSE